MASDGARLELGARGGRGYWRLVTGWQGRAWEPGAPDPPEKGLVVLEGSDLIRWVRDSLVTLALSQECPCPRLLARGPGIPGDCPPASPVQPPHGRAGPRTRWA